MDGKEEAEPISPLTESELTYNNDRSNTAGGAYQNKWCNGGKIGIILKKQHVAAVVFGCRQPLYTCFWYSCRHATIQLRLAPKDDDLVGILKG